MKLVSKFKYTSLLVCFCAGLLAPQYVAANEEGGALQPENSVQKVQDYTKTIKKEFPINATGTVNLTNKYGKVDVKTWDKGRVKIDVTIVVKANSESSAQSVFDRIRVDFTNDDNFVKAETVIASTKSSWWSWGGNDRSEFQINYEVYMPAAASLDLNNKYGDAFVAALDGKATVNVKYGDFRLEGIGGNLNVYLGYGNGTVVKARNVAAEISYSKINFNDVQDVNLTTKYSKIAVEKGADLKAESRYDNLNLGSIKKLNCQSRYGNVAVATAESVVAVSQYTDYKIEHLGDSGDFDLKYGGLALAKLAKGFSNVSLIGKYSDFKITVESGASYTLDAATNYAGIAYPAGMDVTFEKDKGTSHEVKGHTGTQGARSTIKANLSYGGLKVRQ